LWWHFNLIRKPVPTFGLKSLLQSNRSVSPCRGKFWPLKGVVLFLADDRHPLAGATNTSGALIRGGRAVSTEGFDQTKDRIKASQIGSLSSG